MILFRILLWTFIIVMILRFVARFVFPVFQVTRMAQQKMKEMQQQMEQMQQNAQQPQPQHHQQAPPKVKEGDYIDYEEIK